MNGPVTCSEDFAMLMCLWNHMPRYMKDSLWANGTPPTKNTGKLEPDELKCTTSDLAGLMLSVRSSACNKCVKCTPSVPVTAPRTPSAWSSMSFTCKEKSRGDEGQPYFTPVLG
eukprot:1150942-Pelagomonas_calceolata.AAC.1